MAAFVFWRPTPIVSLFTIYPVLMVLAARCGSLVTKIFVMALSVFGVLATLRGLGPFQSGSLNQNLICLQLFIAAAAVTSLFLVKLEWKKAWQVPVGTLLAAWSMAALVTFYFERTESARDHEHFAHLVRQAEEELQDQLRMFENALRGGAGYLSASDSVSRSQWKVFFDTFRVAERFPGLYGMGVIYPLPRARASQFIAAQKRDGAPQFEIKSFPSHAAEANEDYYVITQVEPAAVANRALGVNIASEARRLTAANLSRDSGLAAFTGKITMIHQFPEESAGFLLLMPFYKQGFQGSSASDRRAAFKGWVYAPFLAHQFFHSILSRFEKELDYTIFSGPNPGSEDHFFHSGKSFALSDCESVNSITLAQQQFTFGWRRAPGFESIHDTTTSWIAAAGALFSILLASLVAGLQSLSRRARALARYHTAELSANAASLELRVQERTRQLEQANENMTQREGEFRRLADSMPQIVWTINSEGVPVYFNSQWWSYTGCSTGTNFSENSKATLHPDEFESVLEAWNLAVTEKLPFELEYRIRRFDGTYRWHLGRLTLIHDESGKLVAGYGTATDIHDQKINSEKIFLSELRFRAVLEQSPFPSLLCSPDGMVTKCNNAWLELWNISPQAAEIFVVGKYNVFRDPLFASGRAYRFEKSGVRRLVSAAAYYPYVQGLEGESRWVKLS